MKKKFFDSRGVLKENGPNGLIGRDIISKTVALLE